VSVPPGFNYLRAGQRTRYGTWMGQQQVPPLPNFVLIQDREDGKWWQLTHALMGELDYFAITDDINLRKQAAVWYKSYDEPHLPGHPELRFFVRGGRVGYETVDVLTQNSPITTRKLQQRYTLEVIVPQTWKNWPDELGWERTGQ